MPNLQSLVGSLAPAIAGGKGNLVENLQTLSANAAEASGNLRNLTSAVGSTENVMLLQQTLDSARSTFQNAQKITADLDELTGDPAFRENLRNLVNNLSGLVASTQQLQTADSIGARVGSGDRSSRYPQGVAAQQSAALGSRLLLLTVSPSSSPSPAFQLQTAPLSAQNIQVDRFKDNALLQLDPKEKETAADPSTPAALPQ